MKRFKEFYTVGRAVAPIPDTDGRITTGCGVIVQAEGGIYRVLTDFGNIVTLAEDEIYECYRPIGVWIDGDTIYAMPVIPLQERITTQIGKIERSVEILKAEGIL